FAHAQEALARPVEQHDVDLRHLVEAHDRIVGPRARRHARAIEAHRLLERPARGLDDAALDLVDDAVGIHDLAGVHRGHDARDPHATAAAIDADVGDERAVAGEILVPGERDAAAAPAAAFRAWLPAGSLRRRLEHGAGARIAQVAQPEFDGVGAGGGRQLIDE